MITTFGKLLRKLRIDHNEVLKDMADRLGVTPSFLSAVEVGRKNAPTGWSAVIAEKYGLSPAEFEELRIAEKDAVTSVKISFLQSDQQQRAAALVFAREFGKMSDQTAEQVIKLLTRNKDEEGE